MQSISEDILRIYADILGKVGDSTKILLQNCFRLVMEKLRAESLLGELELNSFIEHTRGMVKVQEIDASRYDTYRNMFSGKIPFAFEEREGKHYFLFSKQHEELVAFELQTLLGETLKAEVREKEEQASIEEKTSPEDSTQEKVSQAKASNEQSMFFNHLEDEQKNGKEINDDLVKAMREKLVKEDMRFSLQEFGENKVAFVFETAKENLEEKAKVLENIVQKLEKVNEKTKSKKVKLDDMLSYFKKEIQKEDKLAALKKEKHGL